MANEEDLNPVPTRQGVEPTDVHRGAEKAFDAVRAVGAGVVEGVKDLLGVDESVAQRPRDRVTSHVSRDLPAFVDLLNAAAPTVERMRGTDVLELDRAGQLATLQAVATFLKPKADGGDQQAIADLASVQRVLTAAAKTTLEDPDLATRPPTTAQGRELDTWDSIESRTSLTYEENFNEAEREDIPFQFSTSDIIRNPGNLRPAGWGPDSGAIQPDSDLGEALLAATAENPNSSRQYFIGSYKNGRPVDKDHEDAVVLMKSGSGRFHVFDTYENGMTAQIENLTRQVVGKEDNDLTVDALVEVWAPKFKADGITIENTDASRRDYKIAIRQAFEDFGLDLTDDKVDATDARHIVAMVVAMWRHEAGRGLSRITGQEIMNALKKSKMAVGEKGRSGSHGLSHLEGENAMSLSVTASGKISMNGSTPRNIR